MTLNSANSIVTGEKTQNRTIFIIRIALELFLAKSFYLAPNMSSELKWSKNGFSF